MMYFARLFLLCFAAVSLPASAQTNSMAPGSAIFMFVIFVLFTLGITVWASKRTKTTKDFYAAGGGITGFQNGLAIAGDYMSAASFLGIAGLVYLSGFDGLIYAIGFLVGWPLVLLLIAEPLRNLGKFTFSDVVAFRLRQVPVRVAAAGVNRLNVSLDTLRPDRFATLTLLSAPPRPGQAARADTQGRAAGTFLRL